MDTPIPAEIATVIYMLTGAVMVLMGMWGQRWIDQRLKRGCNAPQAREPAGRPKQSGPGR